MSCGEALFMGSIIRLFGNRDANGPCWGAVRSTRIREPIVLNRH